MALVQSLGVVVGVRLQELLHAIAVRRLAAAGRPDHQLPKRQGCCVAH